MFMSCPVELSAAKMETWFINLWNHFVIPYLAGVEVGVSVYLMGTILAGIEVGVSVYLMGTIMAGIEVGVSVYLMGTIMAGIEVCVSCLCHLLQLATTTRQNHPADSEYAY